MDIWVSELNRSLLVEDSAGFRHHNWSEKWWEPDTLEFICKSLHGSNLSFIDLGAGIGQETLVSAALGVQTVAVEANNSNCSALKTNVSANHFQSLVQVKHGFALTRHSKSLNLGGEVSLRQDNRKEYNFTPIFLDDLLKLGNRHVIKIDIEGGAWQILSDSDFLNKLNEHDFVIYLSVHIGFFRFQDRSLLGKFKYRLGVVKEISTLWSLYWRFPFFYEWIENRLVKRRFLRSNLFNGNGWHKYPIVISNSESMMKPFLK